VVKKLSGASGELKGPEVFKVESQEVGAHTAKIISQQVIASVSWFAGEVAWFFHEVPTGFDQNCVGALMAKGGHFFLPDIINGFPQVGVNLKASL
jgi:hypothetical protein